MMAENYSEMSTEKLRRKLDQAYDMAGLARQDGDHKDAARHMANVEKIKEELASR